MKVWILLPIVDWLIRPRPRHSRRSTIPISNPLRFFGGTFILNLPERKDRLKETQDELRKLDPEAWTRAEVFPGTRATEAHGFPSIGAYGCFQGHLGILRKAQAMQLSSVLVLEDDLCFDRNWKRDWPAIEAELGTQPWDILNLGFRPEDARAAAGDRALVRSDEPLMLAHCYAVNGPALPRLIAFLETLQTRAYGDPLGGPMHYDGALFHFCRDTEGAIRLRPQRSIAGQRSSRSDIAELRWVDQHLPVVRKIASRLKRLKSRVG